MGQPQSRSKPSRIRRDGWTPARQLRFLDALADTRSVTRAAALARMSRESAYRLRNRAELFAALWDRILVPGIDLESHERPLAVGRIMRLLGNHYRRETNSFWPKRSSGGVTS